MDQGNSDSVPSNQNAEDESKDNNNQTTQQETTADGGDPKPVKPDARTSSDSSEQEEAVTEVEKEKNGVFQMFQLVVVNSYGSQDIKKLPNDDSVLRLTSQTYVACDWTTEVKDKCYDTEAATVKDDKSCEEVPEEPKEITLDNCLTLFTEKEKLGKEDAWFCPECKDFVQATKKFDLWKLPQVLVIHLKRFSYNRYWRDKLDTLIEFPIKGLDLGQYVKSQDQPESVYDLFAVSNHFGGMGGGHYTAYCKNKSTGKWYNFDDSHVSETTQDRIVSSSAYLLFYCRRDEGKVVQPALSRTLSQTFAEEVKMRKKKFNPSETSHDEETMEQEGAELDNTEPHPPNNNNNTSYDDETFTTTSSMDEPD
jgi:ubiquitin carboxyl-terminal hydrolase 4/11/15